MKLTAICVAVVAFSIFATNAAEKDRWFERCESSEDCIPGLYCAEGLYCNRCILPGMLPLIFKYQKCGLELGDFCEGNSSECPENAECVRKIGETMKTCQCEGWTKKEFHQCVLKSWWDIFIEMNEKSSSSR